MITHKHLYKQTALKGDITAKSEAIFVENGASFPLAAGEWFPAILRDSNNNTEFIKVKATDTGSGRWEVVRAQDGSTVKAFTAKGTCVLLYPTPGMLSLTVNDDAEEVVIEAKEYCLSEGACLTVDSKGRITSINTGNTPC